MNRLKQLLVLQGFVVGTFVATDADAVTTVMSAASCQVDNYYGSPDVSTTGLAFGQVGSSNNDDARVSCALPRLHPTLSLSGSAYIRAKHYAANGHTLDCELTTSDPTVTDSDSEHVTTTTDGAQSLQLNENNLTNFSNGPVFLQCTLYHLDSIFSVKYNETD